MRRIRWVFAAAAVLFLVGGAVLLPTGCEEAKGTVGIQISPPSADLTASTRGGQTFTVLGGTNAVANIRPLALPLIWSVADPSLGTIVEAAGYSAVYQRTTKRGVNSVLVRDQYGAEGIAGVTQ
jgi:hypothetical protein